MPRSMPRLERALLGRYLTYSSAAAIALLCILPACERKQEPAQQESQSQQSAPATADLASVKQTELASAKIPGREQPHVYRLIKVTLPTGETMSYAGAERLVFQVSGTQTVTVENRQTTLKPQQGMRIETGLPASFVAQGDTSSQSLHYLLVPEAQADRSIAVKAGEMSEIYRNREPIAWSADKEQVLTLAQLTLPPSTPQTAPHFRTGAALYYVLSGTGQFTSHGRTEEKQPGGVVYEYAGLVHQWVNSGPEPLTLVVATVAPEGEPGIQFDTAQADESKS